MKRTLRNFFIVLFMITSCKTVDHNSDSALAGSTKNKTESQILCGSRGLPQCPRGQQCIGATADDRPGKCQKILCGSRGLAPCGKDLLCQGASADDRPGTCEPRPGSLGASCGSRGQTPCDSGLKCTGPAANDAPGICVQTQNPPVPAPRTGPDNRICTQAIVPLFHPPTGKCHRAINGCQAADYVELGWRKLTSDDECK